ncbi:MAG: acetyl-CoA decarbonylase/synthase complex subunit gamma [Candidatus Nezhaarchaeota archaeon]|nr:acetyl-CoA decarbonylase/synthase complex subunit gamma [Candidatus Nezhaarchaeota archaeon]
MPKILRPLDVYRNLPGTNCGECGEVNCMAFAAKVIERQKNVEDCKPLFKPEYKEKLQRLLDLLRPPVKEVTIGVGDRAVTVGGKVCVYRHELTWYRPTALFFDVDDEGPEEEALKRAKQVEGFEVERVGVKLRLDGVAVRCTSGVPEKFARRVAKLIEATKLPLILCSYDPSVIEEALIVASRHRPLVYAANKDNWHEVFSLASKYKVPVAISTPGDLDLLKSMAATARKMGVDDLVLDPGTFTEADALAETVNLFTLLRLAAIEKGDRDLGYPLMAVPASVWLSPPGDEAATKMAECCIANALITRYADLLVMHTLDPWALLPIVTWRQNVYTDPRVPLSVKPGLYEVGPVDEKTPVFVTGNSALTYFLVRGDVEKSGRGYVICVDTEGISVESSVAGRRFTAEKVAEALKASGVANKIKHRTVIIPGKAARISGELEELLKGWRVFIGPRESSGIPEFVEKVWSKEVTFD